jgi:hypothetical protein
MKLRALTLAVAVCSIFALGALPLVAQNQINLGDGLFNAHFNGNGTPIITTVIPNIYLSGGFYFLANGSASATGQMQGTGTYVIYTPSASPFFLTHNPDDSFTITQTSPIFFKYTSNTGTLTGQLSFGTLSKTGQGLLSTMSGLLTGQGGSFAAFFPNGANASFSIGLTFPLQQLYLVHGFSAVEFQNGVITGAGSCMPLTQGYWKNHQNQWKDGSGLFLGSNFYTNAQLETIFQTPVQGDASLDLAHQLIAALLNIANGTSPLPIQATITDAQNLIGSGIIPENISPSSPLGQQMTGDASILNDYNNGNITGACGGN